jgi:hypothetical protein
MTEALKPSELFGLRWLSLATTVRSQLANSQLQATRYRQPRLNPRT